MNYTHEQASEQQNKPQSTGHLWYRQNRTRLRVQSNLLQPISLSPLIYARHHSLVSRILQQYTPPRRHCRAMPVSPAGIQSSDTQLVMNRQGRCPRQQQIRLAWALYRVHQKRGRTRVLTPPSGRGRRSADFAERYLSREHRWSGCVW